MEKVENVKIPLKLKIRAWWEGYDLEDIKERWLALHASGASKAVLSSGDPAALEKARPKGGREGSMAWDQLRVEMSQLIWGDGYCGPGGREHIETMCKLLSMSSKMSAVVIGAGLGGPARVLAKEFGVWITGYELSEELAEQGMQMSTDAGLGSKAVIKLFDPAAAAPFDRRYDRAFSKEALYNFPDKQKIIKDTFNTLKDGALFLITDYTLSSIDSLQNPDVQTWLREEAVAPYPVTAENMKTELEKAGFTLRVNEDISTQYVKLIESSWANAQQITRELAAKGPEGTAAIKTLMVEAEHWSMRARLLKEGHIHVSRFLAHKPAKSII